MDMKQLDALFSSFTRGCNDEIYNDFTKLLFEFLDALIAVFRKHDSLLRKARDNLAVAVGNCNTKEVVHAFMDVAFDLKVDILNKNIECLKRINEIDLFKDIDIQADFESLSPKTQEAIWKYLGKLVCVGKRALDSEKMFEPLQSSDFRRKILETTIECEKEYAKEGKEITSIQDVMAIAAKINERMK